MQCQPKFKLAPESVKRFKGHQHQRLRQLGDHGDFCKMPMRLSQATRRPQASDTMPDASLAEGEPNGVLTHAT